MNIYHCWMGGRFTNNFIMHLRSGDLPNPRFSKISNGTLNPLGSLPGGYVSRVSRQIQEFAAVASRCRQIWNSIITHHLLRFPLRARMLEPLFHQYQPDITKFTQVSSFSEFMTTFDVDRDECLNEDELINFFAFIKNKVQLLANDAISIQAYGDFKNLMKEVRNMEKDITQWQDNLRLKIYQSQLDDYKTIGNNKINMFHGKHEEQLANLEENKNQRRQMLSRKHRNEREQLELDLGQPAALLNVKPNNRLYELQLKEKLFCLGERVDEALDFRKELNKLEIEEESRVNHLMDRTIQHQRGCLRRQQERERRQLETKLGELQNKLKIEMEKEFDLLIKRNSLHENEIKKIQNTTRKLVWKRGMEQPELHRSKVAETNQNILLASFKMARGTHKRLLTETSKDREEAFKSIDFNLNSKPNRGSRIKTVHKYLESGQKEGMFPLCKMYSQDLEQLNPEGRDEDLRKEKYNVKTGAIK